MCGWRGCADMQMRRCADEEELKGIFPNNSVARW